MKNKIYWLLFFLFLTLPFERLLTLDVLGFTLKLPYLAAIIAVIFFLFTFAKERNKTGFPAELLPLSLFVGWSFLTIFWSIDREKTFIISAMFIFMTLIFLATRAFVKKINFNYELFFIWLGVAASLFSFWQFFGDLSGLSQSLTGLGDAYIKGVFPFPRIHSTFMEPLYFANFLLIPLYLAIKRYSLENKGVVEFLIISTAFFLTLSRGGLFAFVLSFAVLIVFLLIKKEKPKQIFRPFHILIPACLIALSLIYIYTGKPGVKAYFNQTSNTGDFVSFDGTASKQEVVRSYTIKVAIDNWRKHKVAGIGTGAFGSLPEFDWIRKEGNLRQTVNSLYPEILVEEGVVGLFLFLTFLSFIFIRIWRKGFTRSTANLYFGIIILGLFIQYASFSTLYLVYIWVFLGCLSAKTD